MECNKDEAIRAKAIAESKMQSNDFLGARKIAFKAQQLCSDLENLSQMLMVCDVHCASERMFGNEMDWYGILQVDQTADEATVRKQYRKFALQLHPDKNKFAGAESAFKLIGEAQRVLLDKGRRSVYDIKRNAAAKKPAGHGKSSQKTTRPQNLPGRTNYQSNVLPHQHSQQHPPTQPVFFNARPTFWTACPSCHVKYQYYREVVNRSLICQTCKNTFIACEIVVPMVPAGPSPHQSAFYQSKSVPPDLGPPFHVEQKHEPPAPPPGLDGGQAKKTEFSEKTRQFEAGSKSTRGSKRQRKKETQSSESCNTDSSGDMEDDILRHRNADLDGEFLRRSSRQKQNVSYKENMSDDEETSRKRKKPGGQQESSFSAQDNQAPHRDEHHEPCDAGADAKDADLKTEDTEGVEVRECNVVENNGWEGNHQYDCADPDFNDFDGLRQENCFSVGQIWACYDGVDAMPRFYARIMKIFTAAFKLKITWLEPDPDDETKMEWVDKGLPVACGSYIHGNQTVLDNCLMFSHLMSWGKGRRRGSYEVIPRKGETWALFKHWDVEWRSDPDSHRAYEYEFAEVLSDYTQGAGALVSYLRKVKGFSCVFCRIAVNGTTRFQIPAGELLRFSHMVPSFKLIGKEREDVPRCSFELDPASLPSANMEEIDPPRDDMAAENDDPSERGGHPPFSTFKDSEFPPNDEDDDEEEEEDDGSGGSDSELISEQIQIPDPEFFDFDAEKAIGKFKVGQIWSLYSDEDGLPKYYSEVVKISSDNDFQVSIRWLDSSGPLMGSVIQWLDEDMPVCCGRFRSRRRRLQSYDSSASFSHLVDAALDAATNEYVIMPRKGQVWALYSNWSPRLAPPDLQNCSYQIVEVLSQDELAINVAFLEQLEGFNSVFGRSAITMAIPHAELLRFSHQIPAFQITPGITGCPVGSFELDPAALPLSHVAAGK